MWRNHIHSQDHSPCTGPAMPGMMPREAFAYSAFQSHSQIAELAEIQGRSWMLVYPTIIPHPRNDFPLSKYVRHVSYPGWGGLSQGAFDHAFNSLFCLAAACFPTKVNFSFPIASSSHRSTHLRIFPFPFITLPLVRNLKCIHYRHIHSHTHSPICNFKVILFLGKVAWSSLEVRRIDNGLC